MRAFNYGILKEQKWNAEILGDIAAIYKAVGKQKLYLKQRPDALDKLVEDDPLKREDVGRSAYYVTLK